jgi:hypothetical protein
VEVEQIMVAFTAGDSPPLGNVWRITAKNTDFYMDFGGDADSVGHLSVHAPNERFDGHRFHIRVDRRLAVTAKDRREFILHSIPRKGFIFDGKQLTSDAFLVARIRWTWDLQRLRFRAAAVSGSVPELGHRQSGARLPDILSPNDAQDIDLVVSYNKPFWPDAYGSRRDNARLGPLTNEAGLWLTATSYRRSQTRYPAPENLCPRLPQLGEQPNRITCGGPGSSGVNDMYWFVETITSRELIEANAVHQQI